MTQPAPGTVHVWQFDLDQEDARSELLSAGEHARAARFGLERDARRWRTGRSLLRRTLGDYLSVQPGTLKLEIGPYGKPFLPGCSLRFNLSHSGSLLLLAFAEDQEVGIDAERLRSDFMPEELAALVCSPPERDALEQTAPADRHAAFLSLWTAKEAYVKALGMGLSFPLPLLTLTPGQDGHYEAEDLSQAHAGAGISVCRLPPLPGFAASVAAGTLTRVQQFYGS